jgi:hypothetical protein
MALHCGHFNVETAGDELVTETLSDQLSDLLLA